MNIIGLIAEYNPLHNGHIYHINKIKEKYPNSLLILVLNGYFLQRGEISILTKYDKVNLSLNNNIDLIIELPVIYGTQAADIFSDKAIQILNYFKVDKIIFGSECNDINLITKIAKKQLDNNFLENVKINLKKGLNYPTALSKTINEDILYQPNDLLGISYAKTILKNNYQITLETIKRTSDYHDTLSNSDVISASNIRNKINENKNIDKYVPKDTLKYLKNINHETFFNLIKIKILTSNNLSSYLEVDEGIEKRLQKYITESNTLEDFIKNIKTKRYTYNKINRMLIHILIGLKKEINDNLGLDYIHILGFNKSGSEYLNKIKKNINCSLKVDKNSKLYEFEKRASIIYDIVTNSNTYNFELKNKPIIFDKKI